VHDYVGGKGDWAVHGLPLEGRTAGRRRVIDVARKDIPTCGPRERLGDVRERVRAAGQDVCIVVNERGIVLGRLRRDCWERDPAASTEECMELGPPTDRPDKFLSEVIDRLRKVGSLLVTWYGGDPDGGRLVGVLYREDVERVLEENERISAEDRR
jgi:CBS domain-containing protein